MTTLSTSHLVLLGLLAAERSFELVLSRARLRRAGGRSSGGRLEFAALVVLHGLLLALPPFEATLAGRAVPGATFLVAVIAIALAQGLRYWCILALGPAWNARGRVDPGLPVVDRGPYRWIRHPNYLAILIEFTAIPLAFGAWRSWILLNLLHVPLIVRRIRAEERLLAELPGYEARMSRKPRFLPARPRSRLPGRGT